MRANISVIMIINSRGVLSLDRYPEKSATLTCKQEMQSHNAWTGCNNEE